MLMLITLPINNGNFKKKDNLRQLKRISNFNFNSIVFKSDAVTLKLK